ncbi:MAG: hypothetical protein ACI4EX_09360 [Lachnospiraceae bacterium]
MNIFYSFAVKGFIVENITRYDRPDRKPFPCILYELAVSENVYQDLKSILKKFMKRKSSLHYTRLGAMLGILHIPHKWRNHYFCSQFVAEVLRCSKAACLKKDSTLYLPGDFKNLQGMREVFQGNIRSLRTHYKIVQCSV